MNEDEVDSELKYVLFHKELCSSSSRLRQHSCTTFNIKIKMFLVWLGRQDKARPKHAKQTNICTHRSKCVCASSLKSVNECMGLGLVTVCRFCVETGGRCRPLVVV